MKEILAQAQRRALIRAGGNKARSSFFLFGVALNRAYHYRVARSGFSDQEQYRALGRSAG